jgi:hypothetical protein
MHCLTVKELHITILRKVCNYLPADLAQHPRRLESSGLFINLLGLIFYAPLITEQCLMRDYAVIIKPLGP